MPFQSIKKIFAFLLLLLFTVSIGPRAYFHDLVADHRDGTGCVENHKNVVFHNEEIECHFDDLVVSSPYIFQSEGLPDLPSIFLSPVDCAVRSAQFRIFLKNKESRGPPSSGSH